MLYLKKYGIKRFFNQTEGVALPQPVQWRRQVIFGVGGLTAKPTGRKSNR